MYWFTPFVKYIIKEINYKRKTRFLILTLFVVQYSWNKIWRRVKPQGPQTQSWFKEKCDTNTETILGSDNDPKRKEQKEMRIFLMNILSTPAF